jgi:hypothetical protein
MPYFIRATSAATSWSAARHLGVLASIATAAAALARWQAGVLLLSALFIYLAVAT